LCYVPTFLITKVDVVVVNLEDLNSVLSELLYSKLE
jgi:hypothetical protein